MGGPTLGGVAALPPGRRQPCPSLGSSRDELRAPGRGCWGRGGRCTHLVLHYCFVLPSPSSLPLLLPLTSAYCVCYKNFIFKVLITLKRAFKWHNFRQRNSHWQEGRNIKGKKSFVIISSKGMGSEPQNAFCKHRPRMQITLNID